MLFNDYTPARLVRSNQNRWYIEFYQTDPLTGKKNRFRPTFDLNRIRHQEKRLEHARQKIKQINDLLPSGYPYTNNPDQKQIAHLSIMSALEKAWDLKKSQLDRQDSINSYYSKFNMLVSFLKSKSWDQLHIQSFTRAMAFEFLDTTQKKRRWSAVTFNNCQSFCHSILEQLKILELIKTNPFEGIPRQKPTEKQRRMFSDYEIKVIHKHVRSKDPALFIAILLLQFCAIRPREISKLRAGNFNLEKGFIKVSGSQTKNKSNSIVTIPDVIIPFLKDFGIQEIDPGHLVFGHELKPHPVKSCGKNVMNYRHKKILEDLQEKKLLSSIQGLSFYSWKDTGAMQLIEAGLDIVSIQEHFRHESLDTTQKYLNRLNQVNEKIKGINYDFDLD